MSSATLHSTALFQPSLAGLCPVADAVHEMSSSGIEARGAIFTRREVVDFILDLAGYTASGELWRLRVLEPSFGSGDFLLPLVERLVSSVERMGIGQKSVTVLGDCIRAVEVHRDTFQKTKEQVIQLLLRHGFSPSVSASLAEKWLVFGDFLLVAIPDEFDVVVGNPPYVRQELIPGALLNEYRARYRTVYDRADLYIPFIERSLTLLRRAGTLAFICADRWMKNKYGGPLRRMVSEEFHLKAYVDMVGTPAFHSDVIAYPGITVISREQGKVTRVACRPDIQADVLSALSTALIDVNTPSKASGVREVKDVVTGEEPWIFDALDQVALVRRIEAAFPTLAEAGCKVGIGVATGADKAFIGKFENLDVEPDRKLRLVTTKDILRGKVEWRGLGVVNPFKDGGGLVDLEEFPRLKRYLEARKDDITGRHVAKKAPASWFRTIDRITPSIALQAKLLIPDIKGDAHVVFEAGHLYPHHNLYYITSESWDLKALQAVLLSGIARLFVSIYSTKMHGGFLRFQAQYLRRIRVPQWADVPHDVQEQLKEAAARKDVEACNEAVFKLYRLTARERAALKANGVSDGN